MHFNKFNLFGITSFILMIFFGLHTMEEGITPVQRSGSHHAFATSDLPESPSKMKRTGLYIPLYAYPTTATWNETIRLKQAFPLVPFLVCINPGNGPGSHFDINFFQGIDQLKKAGIIIGGYVATNYGNTDPKTVKDQISTYRTWYDQIDGICLDEMSSKSGKEQYYKLITEYSKAVGFEFTIGNPGTSVSPTYVGTVDYLKIYEGAGMPDLSLLKSLYIHLGRQHLISISYDVSRLTEPSVAKAARYLDFIYITDDKLSNPYDKLPYYLPSLVQMLNSTSTEFFY